MSSELCYPQPSHPSNKGYGGIYPSFPLFFRNSICSHDHFFDTIHNKTSKTHLNSYYKITSLFNLLYKLSAVDMYTQQYIHMKELAFFEWRKHLHINFPPDIGTQCHPSCIYLIHQNYYPQH